MRARRALLLAVLATVCGGVFAVSQTPGAQTPGAQTPGPFDGTWQIQGGRTADPFCSQLFWHTLTLRQSTFGGTIGHTRGGFTITGQVTPDGKATFYGDGPYGTLGRGFGQFTSSGASGSIRFTGPDVYCETGWTATRQG